MKNKVAELSTVLPPDKHRAMVAAQQKGASYLVTTLPLQKHGFALSKTEFRDQLLMRYRWPVHDLPTTCACGSPFNVDHSQICHLGGFVNMRHDEMKFLLATEVKKVLKDVEMEPSLSPLTGENLQPRSAISSDDARSDIRAKSFWCRQQNAFFDIRVFYPHARSYLHRSLPTLFETFEKDKKREYGDRITQVERGSFTPLVFSSNGGMGKEASMTIKKLAQDIAGKHSEKYSHVVGLLRCRIHFALMRSAHTCLRGTRTRQIHTNDSPANLVISESQLNSV